MAVCMSMEVFINIIAKNPPSILFVIAFLSILIGDAMDAPDLISFGWYCLYLGVILQVLWILYKWFTHK